MNRPTLDDALTLAALAGFAAIIAAVLWFLATASAVAGSPLP